MVGGLGQIFVTAQTCAGEPDRQDRVLSQELLQLRTQLDRTRFFDSHRVARWVMGGRVISGRVTSGSVDRRPIRLSGDQHAG